MMDMCYSSFFNLSIVFFVTWVFFLFFVNVPIRSIPSSLNKAKSVVSFSSISPCIPELRHHDGPTWLSILAWEREGEDKRDERERMRIKETKERRRVVEYGEVNTPELSAG